MNRQAGFRFWHAVYAAALLCCPAYNVTAPTLAPYSPEKLDAYEVGLKTQFFDRRVTLNAAGFYHDYGNIQVSRFINGSPQVYNGGAAKLDGLDTDLTARITDRLSATGEQLSQAPNASVTVNVDHRIPPPVGELNLDVNSASRNITNIIISQLRIVRRKFTLIDPDPIMARSNLASPEPATSAPVQRSHFSSRYYNDQKSG
jgi:hypothetical protein